MTKDNLKTARTILSMRGSQNQGGRLAACRPRVSTGGGRTADTIPHKKGIWYIQVRIDLVAVAVSQAPHKHSKKKSARRTPNFPALHHTPVAKKEADDIRMTRVTGKIPKAENDLILQRKSDADKGDGDQKAEVTREGAPPLLEKGRAHLLEQEDGSPLAVEGRVS